MTENKTSELLRLLVRHQIGEATDLEVKTLYDEVLRDKMQGLIIKKKVEMRLKLDEIFNTSRNAKLVHDLNETKQAMEDYETVKEFFADDNSNKEEKDNTDEKSQND